MTLTKSTVFVIYYCMLSLSKTRDSANEQVCADKRPVGMHPEDTKNTERRPAGSGGANQSPASPQRAFQMPAIQRPAIQRPALNLHRWLGTLQWLAPVLMVLLVAAYELGPARWLQTHLGSEIHLLAEIILYGTLGPGLVFILLHFLRRWLEERETSELQAQILEESHERAREHQAATDDALQALFAASLILESLQSNNLDPNSEEARALQETRRSLDGYIGRLRAQLSK